MKSLIGGLLNTAPVPYVSRRAANGLASLVGGGPANNAEAQMRAMGSVGTLFSIVHRTSNATAQVNWKLWRSAKSGKDEDRVEVTSHLALDIWRKPNPFMPRQEFVETQQQHLDLTGEAWWVVARNPAARQIPLELWPVRPDRMHPVPHAENFLAGYIYCGPDGEKVPLELDEVVFLRMPNPLDIYRGMGPVQSILTDLDSTRYSAEWNRNFFVNGARPGGIVEAPHRMDDSEWDEFTSRWRESHQGVANAHRVAVLENGLTWNDRAFSMRDLQFVELREVSSKVIREAFGIPKFAVGDVEDVNRATADASKAWFAEQLTKPRLERIKGALNNDFLPLFGTAAKGLEFDYEDPTPANSEAENAMWLAKSTAAKTLIDAHFTAESVVEALELPESLKWEKPEPPPAPVIAPPGQEPGQDGPPAVDDRETRAPAALIRNAGDDPWDYDLDGVQEDWERALGRLLRDWRDITAAQRRALIEQIRDHVSGGNLEQLASLAVDSQQAAERLAEALTDMARVGGQQVVAEAEAQGVEGVAVAAVGAAALGVVATTVAAILAGELALTAGREALRVAATGAGADDVVDAVRERISNDEVEAVARKALGSALTGAQNAGRIAQFRAGPVAALYANEVMDKSTCGPCREVHGRWLGNTDGTDFAQIELTYPLGGYVGCVGAKYGNSCRGTVTGVWRSKTVGGA